MTIADYLPQFRDDAEQNMLDTGKALRPTGSHEYVGGKDIEATAPLFGSDTEPVPCKIQTRNVIARESEAGGRTAVTVRTELHLPADSPAMTVGDIWEFVTVDPLSLATVGQRLRITAPVAGTLKTAARYEVTEAVA